jgi:hypothetical protein
LSDSQRSHLEMMATSYGISSAEYMRRLIDLDRRSMSRRPLHRTETIQHAAVRSA